MNPHQHAPQGGWAVAMTFVVALMLVILPLPDWASPWRPAWLSMVLIYWCMATPQKVGLGFGWMLGLMVDVLTGTLLGQHALALSIVAYLTERFHLQLRVRAVWQQGITVFFLVLMAESLALWVKGIQGLPTAEDRVLWPALTSTLMWPWVFVILRDIRRKYDVY